MPPKHRIKQYLPESYYHIYNRGVEKRLLFLDEQDYYVLLSHLKEYLLPKNEKALRDQLPNSTLSYKDRAHTLKLLRMNNFSDEITFIAYCLMPNHFHFFLKQKSRNSISKFMQSLCTRYTMYFNLRHKRTGKLYQDAYKAALITTEPQFIYLSKYIHRQALASKGQTFQSQTFQSWEGQPSSYQEYLGKRRTTWVHPEEVLAYFSKNNPTTNYQSFVNETEDYTTIQNALLED